MRTTVGPSSALCSCIPRVQKGPPEVLRRYQKLRRRNQLKVWAQIMQTIILSQKLISMELTKLPDFVHFIYQPEGNWLSIWGVSHFGGSCRDSAGSVLASLQTINSTTQSAQVQNHAVAPHNHKETQDALISGIRCPNNLHLRKKAVSPEKQLPFYRKEKERRKEKEKHNLKSYLE